jgi:hypothetical protein
METPLWQLASMAWLALSIIAETNDGLWRSGCALGLFYYALPDYPPGDPMALVRLGIAFLGFALMVASSVRLLAGGNGGASR